MQLNFKKRLYVQNATRKIVAYGQFWDINYAIVKLERMNISCAARTANQYFVQPAF
jgi:hypothetical protein